MSTIDFLKLSRFLVREWRGDRSQLAMSITLGFKSNVVGQWEAGRAMPTAAMAIQAAALDRPSCIDQLACMVGEWTDNIGLATPDGMAL